MPQRMKITKRFAAVFAVCLGIALLAIPQISHATTDQMTDLPPMPPTLEQLQEIKGVEDAFFKPQTKSNTEAEKALMDIRLDSLREAAISYGARGGLAMRQYEIWKQLQRSQTAMTKTFDFRRLLIKAPANLLIEPPIIYESLDAFDVDPSGREAAVSDRIYNINKNARIVAAPRDWRQYLERIWDEVSPPPSVLIPENYAEREAWRKWVAEGWDMGYMQADDILQSDIDRLLRDFTGMVRYRILLSQEKVSAPFAVFEDRGVTGGGRIMRVGDRAIRITGPSVLKPQSEAWRPGDY